VPYVAILPDDLSLGSLSNCCVISLPSCLSHCCPKAARSTLWARLVQLHEQLHNFNSQIANSLPNSLASFSKNSLSQS
jgi:hypothetical protein